MAVEFQDFSFRVKAALNRETINWLTETGSEIASRAASTCAMEDDAGKQLKGSYQSRVDAGQGVATIGTPLEAGYWEEWGTGEYAAHGDGRKGWWIYIPGQESMGGGQTYMDEGEAKAMAAFIRKTYGKEAVATNGRRPNYTLEKAFDAVKNPALARLQNKLRGLS